MRHLLIFLALPLMAQLNNGVRLFDASAATQTSIPRTIHRYFAQGEFPSGYYPKPRVTGSVPATWQVDVENTWPDGSVMAAFVSLPVSIAANGSVVVDFVRDANPCHLGNLATCQAAALDQAGILAFNGGAWDAILAGTANSITYSASARTILTTGALAYRLRGPVVTQVVIEDVGRPNPAFDFGWEFSGGNWIAPSGNQFKSIHPLFTVSFYAGWAGVEVEAMLQNPWTVRGQRQVFDLAVTKSGAASVYSKSGFILPWGSQFSRYFWDGTAPAAVQIDFNLKYMIHTKLTVPYDYNLKADPTVVANINAGYTTNLAGDDPQSCANTTLCGNIKKDMSQGGGRADLGPLPMWSTNYLFVMGDTVNFNLATRLETFNKQIIGNGDAGLTMPILFRELDNGAARDSTADGQRYYFNYQSDQTTSAWGRVYSIQARPTGRGKSDYVAVDDMVRVCTSGICRTENASENKDWNAEMAHMPAVFFLQYVLTGRYSYLMGALGVASSGIAGFEPNLWWGHRNGGNGIVAISGNHRASAWMLRDLHYAAILSPDSWPEKAYFRDILRHNDMFYEGVVNALNGNAAATGACPVTSTGSRTDTFTSTTVSHDGCGASTANLLNGYVRSFPTCRMIASVSSVTVNGVSKTVGVQGVDSGRDWYYIPGQSSLIQAPGGTTLTASDTLAFTYTYASLPTNDWCHGRGLYMRGIPNPLPLLNMCVSLSSDTAFMGHTTDLKRALGGFMLDYQLMTMRHIETAGAVLAANGGPLFKYVNQAMARYVMEPALLSDGVPYHQENYTLPGMLITGEVPQSWTEWRNAFFTQIPIAADLTSGGTTISIVGKYNDGVIPTTNNPLLLFPALFKIENEWVYVCSGSSGSPSSTLTICTGGRGMFGTTATTHASGTILNYDRQMWGYIAVGHEYSNLVLDVAAMFEDLSIPQGTGRRVWERYLGTARQIDGRNTDTSWAMVPRDRIQSVRATPGTGTLALAWTAPSGAACTVALNPTSSDDSTDSAATAHGRAQSYSATGLSAGATTYRITCGTARTTGTATVN